MLKNNVSGFPDNSRVWVFEANRGLDVQDRAVISDRAGEFLPGWAAHGANLDAAWDLLNGRFLVIVVNESATSASGCSIDGLTRFVRTLGEELGTSFLDRDGITFRDGDQVKRVSRSNFREMAASGVVTASTLVFDSTLTTLSAIREGRLEVPASESWHATFFSS